MNALGDVTSESTDHHCPKCDYDLRGLTKQRCPECGRAFSSLEIEAYKYLRWPPQRFFRPLIFATIPWFIAYFFVHPIHDTADRATISWVTSLFLAMPLQLVLASVAVMALEAASERSLKRFGAVLTVILWILILGHIAITVWTL